MDRLKSVALALLIPFVALSGAAGLSAQGADATISVLYFENTSRNADFDWLGKGLADMTATDLASSPRATLVEREQLEKVLKEQELAMSGITDPSKAPALGKILNAQILVYGSFIVSGDALRLDAKAVKSQTGAVIAVAQAAGSVSDAFGAQAQLSARLAAALGLATSPGEAVKTEAAKAYYQGIGLFDQGKYAEALKLFNLAQARDPGFTKPGKSIEDAYRYLKDFKNQRYRREMNGLMADIDRQLARLSAPRFYTYEDASADPERYGFKNAAMVAENYKTHPLAWAGDAPVKAIWELQNIYSDLGDLAMEYFEDADLQSYCYDRMLAWAAIADEKFPGDPFLPETIYQTLFPYRERGQWRNVKEVCERLMGDYPEYRMMWAVEDFYETALDKLDPKE